MFIDNIKDLWKMYTVRLNVISALVSTTMAALADNDNWVYWVATAVVNVLTVFLRAMKQYGITQEGN